MAWLWRDLIIVIVFVLGELPIKNITMSTLKILDYDIKFPYETPYDIQKTYMEKVIHCLHNKVHGVLESPTGTGKTLCLLAPVSAWMRKRKQLQLASSETYEPVIHGNTIADEEGKKWGKKNGTVWYTARTHSQIAQTMAEMRKCDIRGLNIRVLGARDQLCINPEVMKEDVSYVKTIRCKELTKNKMCKYYMRYQREKDMKTYFQSGAVRDIEDLVSIGKSCGICPYFLSKDDIEHADVVFLPYNYIIDQDARSANSLHCQGDVIIFDEGHNVPHTCEESFEFSFTSLDLVMGIKNMKDLMLTISQRGEEAVDDDEESDIALHAENSMLLIQILQKLSEGLENLPTSEDLLPVSLLYNYFEEAGINHESASNIISIINGFNGDSSRLNLTGSMLTTFSVLEKMAGVLFCSAVRSFDESVIDNSFKCCVRMEEDNVKKSKTVCLYCFNPSFGIRSIIQLGVQSMIITSGTLSPLKNFINELNIPKPVTLQNGHIAKKCQVPFLIVETGVGNVRMDAAYTNRFDRQYIISLGNTITNLISSVPDGVLLLFSSYSMMKNLREVWESDVGIWRRLDSLKRIFMEPRGKDEFITCMENYKRAIDAGNGAVIMGVLRGKISEGLDFKDQYCRAVFIIGVPFPPTKDPRVKGKEKYSESLTVFDPVTQMDQKIYNIQFASVEAMRATNQAIGRVIRHGQDYGAIILLDYRFSWNRLFTNISPWIRGISPNGKNFQQAKKTLSDFFRNIHLGRLGVPEVRSQRVDGNGCPIAGYVSYEEYKHIKSALPKSASLPDQKTAVKDFEYSQEENSDILSLYASRQSDRNLKDPVDNINSVFEALQTKKKTWPIYGELESKDGNGTKRKFNDDRDIPQASKLLNESGNVESKPKKVFRFQVRSFSDPIEKEPDESINNKSTSDCKSQSGIVKKSENEDQENLKMKIVNYFLKTKNALTEEQQDEFKKCTFRYMKGEKNLWEVIDLMDKIFIITEKKDLFKDFEICIKVKDKEEWLMACRKRNIDGSCSIKNK